MITDDYLSLSRVVTSGNVLLVKLPANDNLITADYLSLSRLGTSGTVLLVRPPAYDK
jgi:hypothetical protein